MHIFLCLILTNHNIILVLSFIRIFLYFVSILRLVCLFCGFFVCLQRLPVMLGQIGIFMSTPLVRASLQCLFLPWIFSSSFFENFYMFWSHFHSHKLFHFVNWKLLFLRVYSLNPVTNTGKLLNKICDTTILTCTNIFIELKITFTNTNKLTFNTHCA